MANTLKLRDERLRVMEGILDWEGEIGNARVRQLFDLRPVQASRLLAEFRAHIGGRLLEDGRAKVLKLVNPKVPCSAMALDEYARYARLGEKTEGWIVDARVDLTQTQPVLFAAIRKAMIMRVGVAISYASMSNPKFTERLIFPHAIVQVGRRWHIRAWCDRRNEFRDFTLGRIKTARLTDETSDHHSAADSNWNLMLNIRLSAHRGLSPEQQMVVRNEYFSGTMGQRLAVRACLVQYVINDLRAAINPERELPPEFQIEVANAKDLPLWDGDKTSSSPSPSTSFTNV